MIFAAWILCRDKVVTMNNAALFSKHASRLSSSCTVSRQCLAGQLVGNKMGPQKKKKKNQDGKQAHEAFGNVTDRGSAEGQKMLQAASVFRRNSWQGT